MINSSGLSEESENRGRAKSGKKKTLNVSKNMNYRATEEELEQQQKQLKTLEMDRKKLHEKTIATKTKNVEVIQGLELENKEMTKIKEDAMANRKAQHAAGLSKTATNFGADIKSDLYYKNQYDAMKEKVKLQKKLLMSLQDKLQEVSGVKNAASDENPLTRQIRILENKLDKIMIKYNEAQSIRKTYEQIVKRLKEERIGYDNQLAAIERSLKGKEHDYVELLLLSHDATHAKELAVSELRKYKLKKDAVEKLRKKYLDEKRGQIENNRAKIEDRKKKTSHQESMNNNYDDMKNSELQHNYAEINQNDQNNIKNETDDYNEGFKTLFKVTGVNDVNEVIQKLKTQDETMKVLNGLQKSYADQLETLNKTKEQVKEEVHRLKYSGSESQNRKQIDEIEKNVNEISIKCERFNLKYQRVSKILVDVRAGIEHLNKMVNPYAKEKTEVQITSEKLPENLLGISEGIKSIYNVVRGDDEFRRAHGKGYNQYNQRPYLSGYQDNGFGGAGGNEVRHHTDLDEEEESESNEELSASGNRESSRKKNREK